MLAGKAWEELNTEVIVNRILSNPRDGNQDDYAQDCVDGPAQNLHLGGGLGVADDDAVAVADWVTGHATHAQGEKEWDASAEG